MKNEYSQYSKIPENKDQNIYEEKTNIKYEQLQILNEPDNVLMTPEEQFKNDPHYTFYTKFGIKFCKIGNVFAFNFDSKNGNKPKICIGPHWYLSVFANILIFSLSSCIYMIIRRITSKEWEKYLYFLVVFLIFFFFDRCFLINPGIIQNKKMDNENNCYCTICHVYYNPANKISHCSDCNVCVEKIDHHCVWVGKCVAKNNLFSFYAMLVSIGIYYLYIILMCLFGYEKIKKKGT